MSIRELVKGAKKGNSADQDELVHLLYDRMFTICMRYLNNREDAEERVQDGFYRFFNTLFSYRNKTDEGVYPWLRKIMINECLGWLKRKKMYKMVSIEAAGDLPWDEDLLEKISAAEIYKTVAELPPGYRTVFNLCEIEGFDHNKVARLLGISTGTSRSQLKRAKHLLQKMLTSKGISDVR